MSPGETSLGLSPRDRATDPAFAADVIAGLSKAAKTLPCRWLYDARGSELFEAITELPEYYPTRTETSILAARAAEIAAATAPGSVLVEFGSGSSRKTEIVIAALDRPAAYVPIDVSQSALDDARARLAQRFPRLRVVPVVGDFLADVPWPSDLVGAPRLGFFPGSTIGNLTRGGARDLLVAMGHRLGLGQRLVIGADLQKDLGRLLPAYDDAQGVTAAFNLNLLTRINRELGADFDVSGFAHEAVWNADESRVEMHLVSLKAQSVRLLDRRIAFAPQERIHTENSCKYTLEGFRALAGEAGWRVRASWTDADALFSVHDLVFEG